MDQSASEGDASGSYQEEDYSDEEKLGEPHKMIKVEDFHNQTDENEGRPIEKNDLINPLQHHQPDKAPKLEAVGGIGGPNQVSTSMSFKPRASLGGFQPKPMVPSLEYEPEKDYRKEYHRIYLANVAIMDMINQTIEDNNSIKVKISTIKSEKSSKLKAEANLEEGSDSNNESGSEDFSSNRKRKRRRKKEEIKRDFVCSVTECGKSYG